MAGRYGKGHRPNPGGHRVASSRLLLGAPRLAQTPPSASLEMYEPGVMDQGGSSACVGHASAMAIAVSLARAGAPLPWVPSPGNIYCVARCIERAGDAVPLLDNGSIPADAMMGISQWGVRPTRAPAPDGRNSDVDPATVNDEPALDELEQDAQTLLVGEYGVDMGALDAVTQLRAAIAAGYALTVALFVDSAFENWDPSKGPLGAPNRQDPNGGGHYLACTSYRTASDGRTILRGPNSWGVDWGIAGHWEGYADELGLSDVYVMSCRRVSR